MTGYGCKESVYHGVALTVKKDSMEDNRQQMSLIVSSDVTSVPENTDRNPYQMRTPVLRPYAQALHRRMHGRVMSFGNGSVF